MTESLTVHLHGDLGFFVTGHDAGRVRVAVRTPRSVKDAAESLGVPHVEVGTVEVNGSPARLDAVVHGGERVDLHPPAPAQLRRDDPRFVCDVHLGRLARRLRLLGFDTWYRTHADDLQLANVAATQRRILVSRDRGLLMRRTVLDGYCPRSDLPDTQLTEVVRRYDLASVIAPLTRCARCNGDIEAVAKDEILDRLPPATRVEQQHFSQCQECGQIYWPGTHLPHIARLVAEVVDSG